MAPFSYQSRREIGERCNWTCTCGRAFQDGWMQEIAHYSHDKNEFYDNPESGRSSCRICHLRESIEHMLNEEPNHPQETVRLQATRCYDKGLRTYSETNLLTLIDDRSEVVSTICDYGLDPDSFLNK